MKTNQSNHGCRRVLALLLTFLMVMSMLPGMAFAAQPTTYRDPAEHWMNASNRTNELDINSVVSHETFYCYACGQYTSFTIWRTPEYTRDGQTALTRNVLYSDGTTVDGEGTGSILDGDPGVDAFYTGYHWTKACCENCGVMNSNGGINSYSYSKNVYILYDCASGFSEDLDDVVSYEYADDTYHTKTVEDGHYCEFCFGTVHTRASALERHTLGVQIKAQLDKQCFAIVTTCADCDYSKTEYVAAKSVVADYYGVVDGQAHTLTVSDLSESGVSAKIRYGNSADACTLTTPPSYTEEGQYTVYYEITYTYKGVSMTENGVAYVWLRDDSAPPLPAGPGCNCGCGDPDCDCAHGNCPHCDGHDCSRGDHNYILIDTVRPTCTALGYDRFICSICGALDKRNYVNAAGHAYQSVVIRDADCEHEGKTLEICRSCGEVKETLKPKGEHQYRTYKVAATCTAPGYTARECAVCGDRQIIDITAVKGHSFVSTVIAPTCTTGGHTHHVCKVCGESYFDSYTEATGHDWDDGTVIKDASCNEAGIIEYRCRNCGTTRLEEFDGDGDGGGHSGLTATLLVNNTRSAHRYSSDVTAPTCTEMGYTTYTCVDCGDSYKGDYTDPLGHNYRTTVTRPTCTALGYTTYTCGRCGDSYKSDYVETLGHNYKAVITAPTCTEGGFTTFTCTRCGDSYVGNYTAALGHDWKAPVKLADSTCNSEGVLEYDCSHCDAHFHEAISANGHKPGPAATCSTPQTCQSCGAILAPATDHSYEASVTAPTCTTLGYTTYICSACGDSYKSDYNELLGHDYKATVTAPTCTEGGYTTYTCSRCGDSYVDDFTDPLGHDWSEPVTLADSTCGSDGVKEYDCSRCEAHYHEAISAKGHKPGPDATCLNPQTCKDCGAVLAPATGHSYKKTVTAPTCTRMGYTTYTCSSCGDSYKSDYTELLGHDYVPTVKEPTCIEGGWTTWTCSRCGDSYVDDFTDPLGHSWNKGEIIAAPTCTGDGVVVFTCTACEKEHIEHILSTGHFPGEPATCTDPQLCTVCGAVLEKATGHSFSTAVTEPTCLKMGWTTYTCEVCGETYKSDYTDALGHDYVPTVTEPTCTEQGFTTWTCAHCGDSYVSDYADALGHEWDAGTKLVSTSCNGEGLVNHRCVRCDYHYLEALSPKGHKPGPAATCTEDQTCQDCGAVLEKAHGHDYEAAVTAPTCTELGFTTYTCADCGKTYNSDYVKATGHKESDWIIDKKPTTEAEGSRHKECLTCHEKLVTEPIAKLYLYSTTDNKGEATVGEYLVIVTDTSTGRPIVNATVELNRDGTISLRFPDGRLLDYGNHTTVFVLNAEDKTPVKGVQIYVTDANGNYAPDVTDKDGQIIVPDESGKTGDQGIITFGGKDAEGDPFTVTVNVVNGRNNRPIKDASVTISKTGTITVVLPDGLDLDENNPIIITVTDHKGRPLDNVTVIVKGDKDKESGKTGEDGTLTLPEVAVIEKHGAYIYGYPDGTFGPERSMTRAEAAAIFARLLAERKGDTISETARTGYTDIPADAWYSGYVRYLTACGVIVGTGEDNFSPDREITRAEVVAMAVRFFEVYDGGNAEIMEQYAEFNDVSDGYWAAEYIKDAAIHGWIRGYGDGSFRASASITRAEAVTIINRLLGRVADESYIDAKARKLNTFTDMDPKHWAYYDVMESANAHTADVTKGESWKK